MFRGHGKAHPDHPKIHHEAYVITHEFLRLCISQVIQRIDPSLNLTVNRLLMPVRLKSP